jgi:anthranilate synthase/aminodeoxychorismate synthase-like glutamine amidotransferase
VPFIVFLLLDHYDSFTHNVEHMLIAAGVSVDIRRCDKVTVSEVMAQHYEAIILGPGPGRPGDRGITLPLIHASRGVQPVFGVCLGLQALVLADGGRIVRANQLVHGKTTPIEHDGRGVFRGVPSPFSVMRYHSLVADRHSLPDRYEISATLSDGTIMAIRDRHTGDEAVQFHPESFLTEYGSDMARNICQRRNKAHDDLR